MNIPHRRWLAVAALIVASIGVFVAPYLMHGSPAQANASNNTNSHGTTTKTTPPTSITGSNSRSTSSTSSTTPTTGTTTTGGPSGTTGTETGTNDDSSTNNLGDNQASDNDNDDSTENVEVQSQTGVQGTDDDESTTHHETANADHHTAEINDDAADVLVPSETTINSVHEQGATQLMENIAASPCDTSFEQE